jgi:hypothetical protein
LEISKAPRLFEKQNKANISYHALEFFILDYAFYCCYGRNDNHDDDDSLSTSVSEFTFESTNDRHERDSANGELKVSWYFLDVLGFVENRMMV